MCYLPIVVEFFIFVEYTFEEAIETVGFGRFQFYIALVPALANVRPIYYYTVKPVVRDPRVQRPPLMKDCNLDAPVGFLIHLG